MLWLAIFTCITRHQYFHSHANGTMQQDIVTLYMVELAALGAGLGQVGVFPAQNYMSLSSYANQISPKHPVCASATQQIIVFSVTVIR